MQIDMPEEVNAILNFLNAAGHAAYIVGGCVRDSLMGIPPVDWDIATSALPEEVQLVRSSDRLNAHTVNTGIQHGTVTVVINRKGYEVTTFRIDGEYQDGRRPEDVTFTKDLEMDLSRRDFTMNAIAYNAKEGIADPFNGTEDIKRKNIRCVGEAASRFDEDALRMMRAVRFSAQLGFTIDPDTYAAIPPLAHRLKMVSIERVRDELTKILSSSNPYALPLLEETGLWQQIATRRPLPKAAERLEKCPKEPAMLYALLSADEEFMRYLKFDNKTIKETDLYTRLLREPIENDRYFVKVILNKIGPRRLDNLLTLKKIAGQDDSARAAFEGIISSGECYTLKDLAVNGKDLKNAGIPPGPAMGEAMAALLDAVMKDFSLNNKEQLLKLVSN